MSEQSKINITIAILLTILVILNLLQVELYLVVLSGIFGYGVGKVKNIQIKNKQK